MANTMEKDFYNAIKNTNLNRIKQLIEQDVDCNLANFNEVTHTFISPINMAIENDRHGSLYHLYEHRNSPREAQLNKYVTFYVNHYVRSEEEENKILFDYLVSRLLYFRITEHPPLSLHTLIAALNNYDYAYLRGQSLSNGSTQQIYLQLRIFTLFRKIIEMTINFNDNLFDIIMGELLHNLETYYFLEVVLYIPVRIKKIMNKKFTEIKSSQFLLIKYYQCIAKNVINKIEQLQIDHEYTIPTGWIEHAVCVSFRRVSKTHISIRIDNPSPCCVPNTPEIVHPMVNQNQIKPKVLGQLHVNKLKVNLDYFILLIDSIKRDLIPEEGISLIYNLDKQIRHLERKRIEDVPIFDVQAEANCFVKCFEPGCWERFGRTYSELHRQLLLSEKQNADELVTRCEEENQHYPNDAFYRLAMQDNLSSLSVLNRTHLQDQLKTSYKQHYQYLLSNANRRSRSRLTENYVPLRFEKNERPIELKDFFVEPRILLLGEAGCGKSTICRYATYLWAQDKIWGSQYEWLFYINMQNLNPSLYPSRSNNYSLIDIIERECFQGFILNDLNKRKLTNQFENPSKILWILDGCDERSIPTYLKPIERELLAKPNLLLTSRPYQTEDLGHDTQIEVQNFEFQDIQTYINNYFGLFRQMASQCWTFICDYGQLRETAGIPACLEIICNLCENGAEIFDWDMTMGEVYRRMCEHLLRRYLLKFHHQCRSALVGQDIYQQPNAIAFTHLEYLAFDATKSHQFIINGDELNRIAGQRFLSVLQIGLLIPHSQNPSPILADNIYSFVHRSFQEYLCACYLIRALSSAHLTEQQKEVIKFITYEKYNRHFQHIFRLFFELKRSNPCTDRFWSAVDSEPRDLIGIRHCSRIIRWFPSGSCIFSPEDKEKIDTRTIDAVQRWISNKDRRAHDYSNIYLFEWFVDVIDRHDWLNAWEEDLFIVDPSKRRYFLPDVWSTNNIEALKTIYHRISRDVKEIHRLIKRGPTTTNLQCWGSDSTLFALYIGDEQNETSDWVRDIKEKVNKREPITSLTEFQTLLHNYVSYINLNRRLMALDKETWILNVAPSALENIPNETLDFLLKLIQENALFFRFVKLPVISFLQLYAKKNTQNDDTLRSLIVSITLSSECLLIVPTGEKKLIRVYDDGKFDNIELDQSKWFSLINRFHEIRDDYGYPSYF